MAKGQDHVQTAIRQCRAVSESLSEFAGSEGVWVSDTQGRLDQMVDTLEGLKGRFFLRSKLCLPFAAKCARAAGEVERAARALSESTDDTARQRLSEAIDALSRAAKALDERSAMQDMAIT